MTQRTNMPEVTHCTHDPKETTDTHCLWHTSAGFEYSNLHKGSTICAHGTLRLAGQPMQRKTASVVFTSRW